MSRAAMASVTTPAESAAAPTHAPGTSVVKYSTSAVALIPASRSTVPMATSRVRPDRISSPWRKRR